MHSVGGYWSLDVLFDIAVSWGCFWTCVALAIIWATKTPALQFICEHYFQWLRDEQKYWYRNGDPQQMQLSSITCLRSRSMDWLKLIMSPPCSEPNLEDTSSSFFWDGALGLKQTTSFTIVAYFYYFCILCNDHDCHKYPWTHNSHNWDQHHLEKCFVIIHKKCQKWFYFVINFYWMV